MNTKRFVLSAIAVFIFIFIFDFLIHGVFLKPTYEATSHLWRPESDHNMIFMFLSQLSFSFMFAFIFTRHFEGKGLGEGVRYGLLIGALLATIQLGTYCYMPIPFMLTLSWMIAAVAKGVLGGVVLSVTYKA